MNLNNFIIVFTGVILNAVAQLLLKAGTNSIGEVTLNTKNFFQKLITIGTEPFIIGGIACYVVSVGIWIIALSKLPVSIAYPLLSIGYVVNAVLAYYLFNEEITAQKIAGITIIIVGVFIITKN